MEQTHFASEKERKGAGYWMGRVKGNLKFERVGEGKGGGGKTDPVTLSRWGSFCGQQ